jgi:hypothetical protein
VIIHDINALSDDLLIELAKRKATNGKPQNVSEICADLRPEIDWSSEKDLARSAGWLLVNGTPPLAKTVHDSARPGAMLLALTAAGKAAASRLHEAQQPLTISQKFLAVPRSDWIAITAILISLVALFK